MNEKWKDKYFWSSLMFSNDDILCSPSPCTCTSECNELCGDILLKKNKEHVVIFEGSICKRNIVNITIFNHPSSSAFMRTIIFFSKNDCPIQFIIPPGNTVTRILENVTKIIIEQEGNIFTKGKYLFKLCPTHY